MPRRLARWLTESGPAAAELAHAIRELAAVAVTALAPPDALRDAAARVRALAVALAAHVPTDAPPARFPHLEVLTAPADLMPFDPVMGRLSPLAPPLELAVEDGRAAATIAFTIPYGGPPGCVHGGILAACFDQVLNVANLLAGVAGPTVSLEVRYRKPTPLGTALRFEADPPAVSGRRVRTRGVLRDGETVLVEATGVFVTLPVDRVMALTSGRR
jgi:acyl-coenzyme A thioesterase PaaI-like protein